MKRLGRGALDRPVHPLDLAVGPGMEGVSQAMLDTVPLVERIERIRQVSLGAWLLGALDAAVGQNRVDAIRQGFQGGLQEVGGGLAGACVYSRHGRTC